MLFDPNPKTRRRDLFDRERELEELEKSLESKIKLTVLLGIRRIGKTSLLNVAVKELGKPCIKIDAGIFKIEGYTMYTLYRVLANGLSRLMGRWRGLREFLSRVKGLRVAGLEVEMSLDEEKPSLIEILGRLDEWASKNKEDVLIAIDEAQNMRFLKGGYGRLDFGELIRYSMENFDNIRFLVTGSEVGVVMDFLGLENPSSPLYGRPSNIITLRRFSEDFSRNFLKEGFKEIGLHPEDRFIDKVVDTLDGVVGWLTLLGYRCYQLRRVDETLLREFVNYAEKLVEGELKKLEALSPRYIEVLKAVANGYTTWSDIKRWIEQREKRLLPSSIVSRVVIKLVKLGYLDKRYTPRPEYMIPDPVIRKVLATKSM